MDLFHPTIAGQMLFMLGAGIAVGSMLAGEGLTFRRMIGFGSSVLTMFLGLMI